MTQLVPVKQDPVMSARVRITLTPKRTKPLGHIKVWKEVRVRKGRQGQLTPKVDHPADAK